MYHTAVMLAGIQWGSSIGPPSSKILIHLPLILIDIEFSCIGIDRGSILQIVDQIKSNWSNLIQPKSLSKHFSISKNQSIPIKYTDKNSQHKRHFRASHLDPSKLSHFNGGILTGRARAILVKLSMQVWCVKFHHLLFKLRHKKFLFTKEIFL